MLAKRWTFATLAHFFERARRNSEIAGGLRCVQERTCFAGRRGAGVLVVIVIHRFTALDCGNLYV